MTPQQIEAMKLALDALKLNNKEWKSLADSGDAGYWKAEDQDHYKQTEEAITALEEALAEHAMQEVQRLGQEIEQKIGCVNHDCEQCKAQRTEQEPVAFASHGVINWIADKQFQHEADLYTTPPQRTWVGLTEQEHTDIAVECGCMSADWVFYGAAVERKLKERNT